MYRRQEMTFKITKSNCSIVKYFAFGSFIICIVTLCCLLFLHSYRFNIKKRSSNVVNIRNTVTKRSLQNIFRIHGRGYRYAFKQSFNNDDVIISLKKKQNNDRHINKSNFKNASKETVEKFSAIEHDPSIDENIIPLSYKYYLKSEKQRSKHCTPDNPVQKVIVLRSHRTGSHTLSNIFYRYGDFHNLVFALPSAPSFQYYWPLRFHHSYVAKDLISRATPNFVVNVARNSKTNLNSIAASETYSIALVRHPVLHFASVYEYVDLSYFMKLISNETDLFSVFLQDPANNMEKILNTTKAFDPVFHLLKNGQLFDLGFEQNDYNTKLRLNFIIRELDEQFNFVLINEYIDESLVLLQRHLCWQLHDMIYVNQRVRTVRENITKKNEHAILEWSKEDLILYQHFNTSLWNRIKEEDETFWHDVKQLKEMTRSMEKECIEPKTSISNMQYNLKKRKQSSTANTSKNYTISSVEKNDTKNIANETQNNMSKSHPKQSNNATSPLNNDDFEIHHSLKRNIKSNILHICKRLLLSEKDYIKILKEKQRQAMKENSVTMIATKFIKNSTEGNFYHYVLNSSIADANLINLSNFSNHVDMSRNDVKDEFLKLNPSFVDNEETEEPQEILLGN